MTMDYSPWSEREIWPFLKGSHISETGIAKLTKISVLHVTLTPTCMNFLGRFQSIKFSHDHGLKSMVRKGNLAVFEGSGISETEIAMPTKFGVHALHIYPYLHKFSDLISID